MYLLTFPVPIGICSTWVPIPEVTPISKFDLRDSRSYHRSVDLANTATSTLIWKHLTVTLPPSLRLSFANDLRNANR